MSETAGVCIVAGCGGQLYQSREYCGAHRGRWYRYGDPLGKPAPRRRDLTGQRFGHLVAVEYSESARKWRCRCDCGLETLAATGDLNRGTTGSCGRRRRHITPRNYVQAHGHVRAIRGGASEHVCARCRRAPAAHWAYRHEGASQRHGSPSGPWSPCPEDYSPLCVPCHKRADLAAIAADRGAVPLW